MYKSIMLILVLHSCYTCIYLVYMIGFDCSSYTANEGDDLTLKIVKQGSGSLPESV